MPLSSVPDLTKFLPPLIQDAIEAEMDRGEKSAYYDEFEQLYWMYSGWEEVLEQYERDEADIAQRLEAYNDAYQRMWVSGDAERMRIRARLTEQYPTLSQRCVELAQREKGPAGLAILRRTYFARHPVLSPTTRLRSLSSMRSRRTALDSLASRFKTTVAQMPPVSI
ncbi:RHTO0S07e04522g1_1 [Rhodotorula toruloides]|uniref:RHTO0S07e04522g1_1 n=1 Tax=Rhodotorula toruloides TaxID=5286 RepID=A0A061AYS5_RHOTO|nr:RHTO0S07e04522g1_1 [Rhodotorula toruloides]